jgi:light-regulated signal transduction histidine kinase (bacteriophytochrome)
MNTSRPTLKQLQTDKSRLESRLGKAEKERDAALDEARQTRIEMDQICYAAAHDLQEPLRSITSYTQLLARRIGAADPEATEFADYIVEGANRMSSLVRDMLLFARVTPPKLESIPLDSVLKGIRIKLHKEIAESQALITGDLLPEVNADPIQLGLLLQHLIANALKFRSRSVPRVHISAEEEEGEVVVSVRDNGPGIEPRFHQQVFAAFKRLHGREIPGNGLGLALCRRIVQGHGGRIWVESDGQSGSAFRFRLPR